MCIPVSREGADAAAASPEARGQRQIRQVQRYHGRPAAGGAAGQQSVHGQARHQAADVAECGRVGRHAGVQEPDGLLVAHVDRVTALMKMYTDGKHDKLFKHGTMEENARKEAILREINETLIRKNHKMAGQTVVDANGKERVLTKTESGSFVSTLAATPASATPAQKRRKLETGRIGASSDVQDVSSSENFRARVLELIESKIQFDMDQRQKETELREQEFELQKRFLEYLQSK
ncbi:unnamed protein product [Phytophthora lilii]|uniref:Unnamed protein product n=1 Tax=Phytophthora lilii TaxID=2077276 RepID=A0A9W6TGV9_9STRA|nr:unnamed protein product [Phytophthora lilii]